MKYANKFMMVPYVKPYDVDVKRDKQQSLNNEMSTVLADESLPTGIRLQKYLDTLSRFQSYNPTGSRPYDVSAKIEPPISDPILITLNKILQMLKPSDIKPKDNNKYAEYAAREVELEMEYRLVIEWALDDLSSDMFDKLDEWRTSYLLKPKKCTVVVTHEHNNQTYFSF
jgi:hypothetical protein